MTVYFFSNIRAKIIEIDSRMLES